MAMIGKVRRLHHCQKKSAREIARITSLSRNTVRKWFKAPVEGEPKYRRSPKPGKLGPFHEMLKQALKVDARRPRHERRTARALYPEIKAAGYGGGYTRLTDFIRAWRQGQGQGVSTTAFVPLVFEMGEAFQFDWSEEGLVVGGIYYRMQVAHMKLWFCILLAGADQPPPSGFVWLLPLLPALRRRSTPELYAGP